MDYLPDQTTEPSRQRCRFARWRPRLTEFEFDAVNLAGTKHQTLNALSDRPKTEKSSISLEDNLPTLRVETDKETGKNDILQLTYSMMTLFCGIWP